MYTLSPPHTGNKTNCCQKNYNYNKRYLKTCCNSKIADWLRGQWSVTLNKLFSICHSCQGSFVRGRMRLLSIYLVYLFRCIPEEDKLLTGDGLEGFLSRRAAVFFSCQPAFTLRRASFTSCRLESRSPEERSSWSSGGKSARLPVQAGGCSGSRPRRRNS